MKMQEPQVPSIKPAEGISTQLRFAGVNIGRGHVKLKTDARYVQYASLFQRSKPAFDDLRFMQSATQQVTVEGVLYDVGEEVALTGERAADKNVFSNWATSTTYQVLMQSVLDRLASEWNGPWAIMLGMPVSEYKDEKYKTLLLNLWKKDHETANGPVLIRNALATPEPLGAFWQFVMANPKREEEMLQQRVIVVDIGYFTTDINAVNRMHLNWSIAHSLQYGMRDVYRLVADLIQKKHQKTCTDFEVEMAVLGKWPLVKRGRQIDISEEVNIAVTQIGERIMQWVRSTVDQTDGLVLVCGGGAHLFTKLVRQTLNDAKVEMVDDPQQANAYGYWCMVKAALSAH